MTDIEMLKLAAKAAGLNVKAERVDCDDSFVALVTGEKFTREKIDWNPISFNKDAFELAVELNLFNDPRVQHEETVFLLTNGYGMYEARRRAITIVAAEIGKKLQNNESNR